MARVAATDRRDGRTFLRQEFPLATPSSPIGRGREPRLPGAWPFAAVLGLLLGGCDGQELAGPQAGGEERVRALIQEFSLGPLPAIPYPADNAHAPQQIALGRLLFFDPILGGESAPWIKEAAGHDHITFRANDVACGTCHHPAFAFADARRLSAGVSGGQSDPADVGPDRAVPGRSLVSGTAIGIVPRNAPTILNTAFNGLGSSTPTASSFMFYDGRVTGGLEAQVVLPIASRDEMAGDAYPSGVAQDSVVARIRAIPGYLPRFREAFPGEVDLADDIEIRHLGRALAAYERELVTPGSRYDRFVSGELDLFTPEEALGFELFFEKARCGVCHNGPMLSDYSMHVIGVGDDYESAHPGFAGKNGEGGTSVASTPIRWPSPTRSTPFAP